MRAAIRAVLAAAALLLAVTPPGVGGPAIPTAVTRPDTGSTPLLFRGCELEHPLRLSSVAAQCAELAVPEGGTPARTLNLHIARVGAISRASRPEPLFILAGGPGLSASSFYASVAPAFEAIRKDHELILVDQRGTGASGALECPFDESTLESASPETLAAAARSCRSALERRADLRRYTTSVAVQDLERVRAALGAPRIDLYASSYGTRVAQHYLRRYPGRVHAVVLDGVIPPPRAVGADSALDAQAALDAILARCTADGHCHAAFGDPAQALRAVLDRLGSHPVPVSLPDPTTGAPRTLRIGRDEFATVVRLDIYADESAALLPFLVHQADAGRYEPVAAQYLTLERLYHPAIAIGMHNSVVCTEDEPFYDARQVEARRAQLAGSFMGTRQVEGLQALCREWPRGALDPDLHAPLESNAPVLLLSGGADPVTPAAWASEAARGLHDSLQLALPGFGHGQLLVPCVDRVMASFLAAGTTQRLDVSCTRAAHPVPFFVSAAGPAP